MQHHLEYSARMCVCLCLGLTCIFWVADCEWALFDLLLKQVFLVEEEDDGGVCEPLVVADGVEQLHALVHSVLKERRDAHY